MNQGQNKGIFRILIFLQLLLFVFSIKMTVYAQESKQVIRVAYPMQKGLTEIDQDGHMSGYTYDYLMQIAKYTGWKYEFVQLTGSVDEQLTQALTMLADGEVDLLGGLSYSKELANIYDYPGNNYGTAYYSLCAMDRNPSLNSGNYYKQPKLKVGVYSTKNLQNSKLQDFSEMSGTEMEQVICKSEAEQLSRLESGEVDAILIKDISIPGDNLVSLATFFPTPFYFATTKGNQDITSKLNLALMQIDKESPYLSLDLKNKYFSFNSDELYFSDNEKEFIERQNTVKVLALGGRAPIQYIDRQTGEYRGVSVDVLDYISEKTGIKFDIYMTDSFDEYCQILKNKEADLVLGVNNELAQYDFQRMNTTASYLETPVVMVLTGANKPKELIGKRLAMPKDSKYEGTYKGEATYYNLGEECLQAVHVGDVDYCYASAYTAQYFMSNPECKNLITIPQAEEWILEYEIGVMDPDNEMLLEILNRTIRYFETQGLMQGYLYNHAYRHEDVTFLSYLTSNPMEAALFTGFVLLVLTVVVLLLMETKERKNRFLRQLENERYEQISEISNEYLFEYNKKEDKVKLSDKCASYLRLPRMIENVTHEKWGEIEFINNIMTSENKSSDIQMQVENGLVRWVRITTKWIKDRRGEAVYLVGKITDIQKEKEEQEKLQEKAEKDALTGVYNMATFREKIAEIYAKPDNKKYTFYIIDIDYFKAVNDTYGHFIGDLVLEKIGNILSETFSEEGSITGRLGGDEFVVHTNSWEDNSRIEEKCKVFMQHVKAIDFPERKAPVTVSIGITETEAGTGADFDVVYKCADEALYEIKEKGRNGFCIYGQRSESVVTI